MASIQFSHISKVFMSGTEAVKNFNLDIEDGEFVVIVGSSGCGKMCIRDSIFIAAPPPVRPDE